ncbi:MAG TPA: GNAT family N-acetyltransferase [Ruania sp.]|nr:GNAT family N-acetyltransferase [Ruania sp.]
MNYAIRRPSDQELAAARRLTWEAFGTPSDRGRPGNDGNAGAGGNAPDGANEPPQGRDAGGRPWPGPGFHTRGAFDGDRLLGQVMGREFHTWCQGVRIPTCGVAGVTIGAEHRGAGLIGPLMTDLLTDARDSGDVLATLYATAPGIYHRFGFETVSAAETVTVPATSAAAVRPGRPVQLRRAQAADIPAVRRCYQQWAHGRTGALDRVPPSFASTDEQLLARYDAITLALDEDGTCLGYLCWDRGSLGSEVLRAQEFIACDEAAYRALWRLLGSFSSVTPTIELRTCPGDPARVFLPTIHWAISDDEPYMLRILDVPRALAARTGGRDVAVTFAVSGDECGLIEGTYRAESAGGRVHCSPTDPREDVPVLTVRGLSALYAGILSGPDLLATGHLRGGSPEQLEALTALLVHQPWQVHDEF